MPKRKGGGKKPNQQQKNKAEKTAPTQAPKEQAAPKKPKTVSGPSVKIDEYLTKEFQKYTGQFFKKRKQKSFESGKSNQHKQNKGKQNRTEKYAHMKTFFGIFTKHNLQQYRLLLKYSGINVPKDIETSTFEENLYKVEMRDINQFSSVVSIFFFSSLSSAPRQSFRK
ncbi:hypothetical protein RFI_27284 [Reticulomyxa filosa]|uniref:Uncharacterized protein n=1 Tax=Reticulomyxa filosa TaxID=46433 RepID=X6M7Y3_RETFI|nr:hypothetical protein RFI_27284 [Reticulomyxa filosa]|eukprot:ETO10093.1 hypothetical protein RFI_27284 [Reticulomyxa filosa]